MKRALSEWSRLRPLLGDRRALLSALVLGSMLSSLTESAVLAILANGAAALVNGAHHAHFALGELRVNESIGLLFLVAVILALLRLALQVVLSVVPARIGSDLQARLRNDLFAAFTLASWRQQARDLEGHLQELLTGQIVYAASGALQGAMLIVCVVSFMVLVLSAFALDVVAALIVLVAAVGLFALMRPLGQVASRRASAVSQASLAYAEGVNESVRLAVEAQVFGVGAGQRQRIGRLIEAVRAPFFELQVFTFLVPGVYQSLIYVLVAGALAALYAAGAGHIAALGAVVLLLVRAGSYGQHAQASYQLVVQAVPYFERIQQTRQHYLTSAPGDVGRRFPRVVRTFVFENVSFAYESNRPVLSEINFAVSRHETVGIVGPTGAGKSTLVQILLRLREPTSGRYLVNGVPAADFSRADWHKAVAYLPQEPRLLHASVADNVRFFRQIDDDAIRSATRIAGIHDEIIKWPAGYDTIIGPRADAISGGQQQRICLARALAARPEVLVLDEPTSALDPRAERLIQESLMTLKDELTLFVVAHRMSTLDTCERVMVIVNGRLEAFDTADALVSNNAYYRSASALTHATSDRAT